MLKYQLITSYSDLTSKSEIADLPSIMRALAIYVEEPDFFTAHIVNCQTGEVIAQFGMSNNKLMGMTPLLQPR